MTAAVFEGIIKSGSQAYPSWISVTQVPVRLCQNAADSHYFTGSKAKASMQIQASYGLISFRCLTPGFIPEILMISVFLSFVYYDLMGDIVVEEGQSMVSIVTFIPFIHHRGAIFSRS